MAAVFESEKQKAANSQQLIQQTDNEIDPIVPYTV